VLEIVECGAKLGLAMQADVVVAVEIPQVTDNDYVVLGLSIRRYAAKAQNGVRSCVIGSKS